jgi:5-oxoprolinase (ATP-hydrolysing)
MAGGGPGKVGRNYVIRKDGAIEALKGTDSTEMAADDVIIIETPGGGAYGKKPAD